ncbi:MAG: AraC family transcriptional regulator [Clostridium sp.]|nr:AraC family transcriptional regulator [Bacteroides sp.]MCM1199328.1 AraC family transcriptional regulator [Clostridium sp.]
MVICIKNMVCPRCVSTVRRIAESLGLPVASVRLGECELACNGLDAALYASLERELREEGFEILVGREVMICEKVKNALIELVFNKPELLSSVSVPDYVQEASGLSYSTLRKLFISVEGRTVEQYLISVKIERVKEFLRYGEKTVSEIAFELGYSSAPHLSTQFKQVTGMSPKEFRNSCNAGRKSIDSL